MAESQNLLETLRVLNIYLLKMRREQMKMIERDREAERNKDRYIYIERDRNKD